MSEEQAAAPDTSEQQLDHADSPMTDSHSPSVDATAVNHPSDGSECVAERIEATFGETEEHLESLLQEKDALVEALTQQLEHAAEELDRWQRTGGRGGISGGGLPQSLVEQQSRLADELTGAVQQWSDIQAEGTLGRIEMQLSELRDLILERSIPSDNSPPQSAPPVNRPENIERRGTRPATDKSQGAPASSGWDAIKEDLLASSEKPSPADQAAPAEKVDGSIVVPPAVPDELPPPPDVIDLEQSTVEELRCAVLARDDYVAALIGRLRTAERHTVLPNWSELESVPDQLREQLVELKRKLEEQLRLAEVELSLERARLARSKAEVHQQSIALERQRQQQSREANRDKSDDESLESSGRWFRFLGRSRKEQSDD